jgi:hypothetical protein
MMNDVINFLIKSKASKLKYANNFSELISQKKYQDVVKIIIKSGKTTFKSRIIEISFFFLLDFWIQYIKKN